jgi:hypothetical protein
MKYLDYLFWYYYTYFTRREKRHPKLFFGDLVFITIPPIYCVEQIYNDSEALRSEKRMLSLIVVLVWFLVLGIICMISYFVFDYDILQKL